MSEQRIERLEQWISDCQAGMYINCVYCGHRYGPDDEVPAAMADVLKDHIAQCPQHPMSALKEALEEIAKGEGPFSRDPLTHASNTIDSMVAIAVTALAKAGGPK